MNRSVSFEVPPVPEESWAEFFAEPFESISDGEAGLSYVHEYLLWISLLISVDGVSIYQGTHPPAASLVAVATGPARLVDDASRTGERAWDMGHVGPTLGLRKVGEVAELTVSKMGLERQVTVFNEASCEWAELESEARRITADAVSVLRSRLLGTYRPLLEVWLRRPPWYSAE